LGGFQEAKKLLNYGCPELEDGINYEAMGVKWYRVLVIPLSYYPGMDDPNNTNQLRTISPLVPPAELGIRPADHGISIPPPSPDNSMILSPPSQSTKGKEKEKDESNVGGLVTDLAEGGCQHGTSTPTEKQACTDPPAPTKNDTRTIPPTPTKKEAITTPPDPTGK